MIIKTQGELNIQLQVVLVYIARTLLYLASYLPYHYHLILDLQIHNKLLQIIKPLREKAFATVMDFMWSFLLTCLPIPNSTTQ